VIFVETRVRTQRKRGMLSVEAALEITLTTWEVKLSERLVTWDGTDEESMRYNVLDAIWPKVGAMIALCLG
jgi:hypothetical protein